MDKALRICLTFVISILIFTVTTGEASGFIFNREKPILDEGMRGELIRISILRYRYQGKFHSAYSDTVYIRDAESGQLNGVKRLKILSIEVFQGTKNRSMQFGTILGLTGGITGLLVGSMDYQQDEIGKWIFSFGAAGFTLGAFVGFFWESEDWVEVEMPVKFPWRPSTIYGVDKKVSYDGQSIERGLSGHGYHPGSPEPVSFSPDPSSFGPGLSPAGPVVKLELFSFRF